VFALAAATPCVAIPIEFGHTGFAHGTDCHGFVDGKAYPDCYNNSYVLGGDSIGGNTQFYKNAFNRWNTDGSWTMNGDGTLPGGKFLISTFNTFLQTQNTHFDTGGVEIQIDWSYAGADKGDFFWTQAILRNFDPHGGAMQPENFNLDLKTPCDSTHANLSKTCPPLYPFQYGDRHFYDRPVGPIPYGHEDFLAELAKVDWTAKKLTLYGGVAYGFQLSVPEPSTAATTLAAMIVLMALRFRRRRCACPGSRMIPL
jgi:hypothetical protein